MIIDFDGGPLSLNKVLVGWLAFQKGAAYSTTNLIEPAIRVWV